MVALEPKLELNRPALGDTGENRPRFAQDDHVSKTRGSSKRANVASALSIGEEQVDRPYDLQR